MKSNYLLILLLSLMMTGCSKEKDPQAFLVKTWTFSETPQKNMNYYMGNLEDRTIFDGTETIAFTTDGKFLVNGIEYGSWTYKENEESSNGTIVILQTPYHAYSYTGFGLTGMDWEIEVLEKDKLVVNHAYYKYDDNKYRLK